MNLVDSLIGAAPTLSSITRSRLRPRRVKTPAHEAMALLADHLIRQVAVGDAGELREVLRVAEAALDGATPGELDVLATGLIEALHHGVSHETRDIEQNVVAELPAGLRTIWEQCRDLHLRVDRWLDATDERAGSGVEPVMFHEGGLRTYLRSTYWRSPAGDLVGLADVLRYEVDHLESQQDQPPTDT